MIEALNNRYDAEYSQFEERVRDAIFDKEKELADMKERIALQGRHSDDIERELERKAREIHAQERMAREARMERDQARRDREAMRAQVNDYQSQVNEYKAIIKRMSALNSRQSLVGSSCSLHKESIVTNEGQKIS